jgi:hypothetical protein
VGRQGQPRCWRIGTVTGGHTLLARMGAWKQRAVLHPNPESWTKPFRAIPSPLAACQKAESAGDLWKRCLFPFLEKEGMEAWQVTSIIPATQEAEIGRIVV